MPSANDSRRMRPGLAVIALALGSLAGSGCTQIPEPAPRVRIPWMVSPSDPEVSVGERARLAGAAAATSRAPVAQSRSSGARGAPGAGGDGDIRSRPAAAAAPAAARTAARPDEVGILHVNQLYRRGPRGKNGTASDRSAGRVRPASAGIGAVAVHRRSEGPPLEPSLDPSGPSGESGSRDARGGSLERDSSESPERTVVRGARSGDGVSEMTRFVRPAEPPILPIGPADYRTVFSDPAVFSVDRPLFSWTRCGHSRF